MNISRIFFFTYISLTFVIGQFCWSSFFLDQGIGIRGMQMGGAYTANPKGNESVYWNPANLAFMNKIEFSTGYCGSFIDGLQYSGLVNFVLSDHDGFGVGYLRSGVTDVPYTNSNGTTAGANFQFVDEAILLSYGHRFARNQSFGITAKQINQKAIDSQTYFSFDLGYKLRIGENFHVGLVGQNIYQTSKFISEVMPVYKLGLAWEVRSFSLNYDCGYSKRFDTTFSSVGASYTLFNILVLKAGYYGFDSQLYLGTSLKMGNFVLDYLFSNSNQDLAVIHKIGFGIFL